MEVFRAHDGRHLRSIGDKGLPNEQLVLPVDVAIQMPVRIDEDTGNDVDYPILYVSDGNCRVQAYNADNGEYIRTFGCGTGWEKGELNNPVGLSVRYPSIGEYDAQGLRQSPLLYVSDSNNHRVQVFDTKTGKYSNANEISLSLSKLTS